MRGLRPCGGCGTLLDMQREAAIPLIGRPRVLRLAGAIHHVVLRHPDCEPLFTTASHRVELNLQMAPLLRRHRARAHGYCWMTNHVHMAVEIDSERAESFQRDLASILAIDAQQRPPLLVDAKVYLLRLVRYIHLNPVRAGLVTDAAAYPWSGHRKYLGLRDVPWLAVDHVLRLLGGDLLRATAAYRAFVTPDLIPIDRESLMYVRGFPGRL